jgi:hypothetical protein
MATKPWEVQAGGTGAATATQQEQLPSDAPQDMIDENDPRLVSESIEMNTDADAYAQPAPPPDAKYRAKLKLEGVDDGKGGKKDYGVKSTNKEPKILYYETRISCSILDPGGRYDGITVYPEFGGSVGTLVNREGASKISTILARIKRPDGEPWAKKGLRYTQKEWIDLFIKSLMGEPEIGIETQWQVSCQACGEEATARKKAGHEFRYPTTLKGMHRFPREKDPSKNKLGQLFDPEVVCQVSAGHGFSRAQARVVGFLSLDELKKNT